MWRIPAKRWSAVAEIGSFWPMSLRAKADYAAALELRQILQKWTGLFWLLVTGFQLAARTMKSELFCSDTTPRSLQHVRITGSGPYSQASVAERQSHSRLWFTRQEEAHMASAEEYHWRAQQGRDKADQAESLNDRTKWTEIADAWEQLARTGAVMMPPDHPADVKRN